MPYYGDPKYLMRAVASVRALRDTDWRLTIVEDVHPRGGEARQAVEGLADGRIRYLRNAENLGVARNTFQCLELAEREHLVLMDYDDLMLPNYGSTVRALFGRDPAAVAAQPGVEIVDEDDRAYLPLADRVKAFAGPVNRDTSVRGEAAVVGLLRGNWTYAPAICYRRSAAQKLTLRTEGAAHTHDLARLVDLLMLGGSMVVGSEVAFRYRRHRHSQSSSDARTGDRFASERAYYRTIAGDLRGKGWRRAERAARLRLFSRFNALVQVPGALRQGRGPVVRALVGHALG